MSARRARGRLTAGHDASLYGVAVATAVAVVALLVGLSVAPRVQPSDWFQVKPRAVKQPIQEAGAPVVPGHGSAPRSGDGTPFAVDVVCAAADTGWAPDLDASVGAVGAPTASGPAGRVATAAGCRGPPR